MKSLASALKLAKHTLITSRPPIPIILTHEEELEKEACELSFYSFIKFGWHALEPEFREGFHIQVIAEHLQALYELQISDLIINQPFRTGKSIIGCVMFPSWVYLKESTQSFIFSSYNKGFAMRDNEKTAKLINSPWYQKFWGDKVKLVKSSATVLETSTGGTRRVGSVGSSVTGHGANFICCDDANSAQQAFFDTDRENTNRWFDSTLSSRYLLPENRRRLVIQQRIHQMDLTGHIMSKGDDAWVHLFLPMEFEPSRRCTTIVLPSSKGKPWSDPRRKEGELLWPKGIDRVFLERLKTKDFNGDSYIIAGQLQQRPAPAGGGIFKTDWFQKWKDKDPPEFTRIISSWDTALTSSKTSCYSACVTFGIFEHNGRQNAMLLSLFRERVEYPELRKMATRLANNYHDIDMDDPVSWAMPPDLILIEAKVSGYSLFQDLSRANLPVFKFNPARHGDKTGRARLISHILENGLVWIPTVGPKYEQFSESGKLLIESASIFPNDEANDVIDAMSQTFIYLMQSGWVVNKEDPRLEPKQPWENKPLTYEGSLAKRRTA